MFSWYILIGICYITASVTLYSRHYENTLKLLWSMIEDKFDFELIVPKTAFTAMLIMMWVLIWPIGIIIQIIDDIKYKKNNKNQD